MTSNILRKLMVAGAVVAALGVVACKPKPAAETVRQEARALRRSWSPIASAKSIGPLVQFDAKMKSSGLNPGTTADFVVATLFAAGLIERKHT